MKELKIYWSTISEEWLLTELNKKAKKILDWYPLGGFCFHKNLPDAKIINCLKQAYYNYDRLRWDFIDLNIEDSIVIDRSGLE